MLETLKVVPVVGGAGGRSPGARGTPELQPPTRYAIKHTWLPYLAGVWQARHEKASASPMLAPLPFDGIISLPLMGEAGEACEVTMAPFCSIVPIYNCFFSRILQGKGYAVRRAAVCVLTELSDELVGRRKLWSTLCLWRLLKDFEDLPKKYLLI